MLYEEIKDKYFPLLSSEVEIRLTVGELISIMKSAIDEETKSKQDEAILSIDLVDAHYNRLINIHNGQLSTIYLEYKTFGDILEAGRAKVAQLKGVGKTSILRLQDFFEKRGYNF